MKLATRAGIEVPRPIEAVFDLATGCDGYPRFLLPLGPIPGVASAKLLDAPAPRAGARREVAMSDGSRMQEEILSHERPTRHRYRWLTRPAPPFSWLLKGAEAEWRFTSSGGATQIDWVYEFEPTSALAGWLARPLLLLFRRWMQRGLDRLRAILAG
jgi:uncharacterized protein YndB with AHSA1/START domain